MHVVKRYDRLEVGDEVLIVDYIDGCVQTLQGTITNLAHGEIDLNGQFSLEWADDLVIIRLRWAPIAPVYTGAHRASEGE